MVLNGEELHAQAKFEQEQYARPTLEQLEIARLEQQLQHAQNSVGYYEERVTELDDQLKQAQLTINQLNNQRDRISGEIAHYESHERSAGITLDAIRGIMRWT